KGGLSTSNNILLIHYFRDIPLLILTLELGLGTPQDEANASVLYISGIRRTPAPPDLNVSPKGGLLRGTPGDNIGATPAGLAEGSDSCNRDSRLRRSEKAFQGSSENSIGPEDNRVRRPEFKMPTDIKLYDGTTNSKDHLSRFSSATNLGEWPMPVWCRMFQQTCDGNARGWFENLPNGSIDGWAELRLQFTTRFSTRRACFKHPTEITKIVRRANETLGDFKERWIVETGFITGVPEVMKISSFMDAHKCPKLAKRFSNKVPNTVDEMMTRLDDFVRSEEAFASTEQDKGEMSEVSRKLMGPISMREDRFNRGGYGADRRRRWEEHVQQQRWASTISPTESQLNLQPPRPMQLPPKKENQDRYCDYHGEKENYTNDCFQLKRQLEMALESGKLNHLIKDVRQRGRGNAKGRDARRDKIINMIRSWPDDKKRKSVERDESWMKVPIMFPPLSVEDVSDEPLVIEAFMEGYLVLRVYVDQEASLEVMFEHCFENLSPAMKSRLRSIQMDLVGLAEGVVKPLDKIELEVVFDDGGLFRMVMINFTVVRAPSPYNVIFGRTGLRALRAVSSTIHSMIKFPTSRGIGTLVTRTAIIAECQRLEKKQMIERGARQKTLQEYEGPERLGLTKQTMLLKKSMDVFTWEPADMTGDPGGDQRSRRVGECEKIRPVRYPTWIANPVLVKKIDGSWRMCMDFKNLNSACPDDYYPSPDIDGKIKSVVVEPKKCSFGVEEGKFLGYMVTSEGIWANPKKTKEIADMQSPRTLKEMQSLSGKLAALKRFLSRSAEKSLPFFETLKDITKENKDEYRWNESAEKAFQEMKQCIVGQQRLYFEAHPIKVITDQPLKQILNKAQASGKLAKYSVELGTYNIAYEPRNAIKRQVLADFLSEALVGTHPEESVAERKGRNEGSENEDKSVRPRGRRTLQKRTFSAYVKMCRTFTSELCYPRDTHRILRNAYRGEIKAKSLARITRKDVKKFVWDNIVCRFGLPRVIVTDNETQFVNDPFKGWCESLIVKQMNTAVAHPQANGLVERANKSLMEGIKARLGRERPGWVDELPNVLWAYRTSLKQSNGETPFSLTCGSKAVIPVEIGMPTHRTMMIREDKNEDELRLNMDLLQERRETVAIREAKYKTKMEQYYN
nr:hypothetical protein [Tanacetum cinerariifolium]